MLWLFSFFLKMSLFDRGREKKRERAWGGTEGKGEKADSTKRRT